jgi:hypothetical protein
MAASKKQVGGDHYRRYAIQPSEFIQQNQIDWLSGNIIKYACRHQDKGGPEDVKKIIHYAELLLEWMYGDLEKQTDEELGVDTVEPLDLDDWDLSVVKAHVDKFMDELEWPPEGIVGYDEATPDDLVEALIDLPTPELNDAVERLVEEQEFRERVLRSTGVLT